MINLNSTIYNITIGKTISLTDIEAKTKEVIKILYKNLGYCDIHALEEVRFNNRLKKSLALTRRKNGTYSMDFNTTFIKTASEKSINDVIAHECVHLIPGCWQHNENFKRVGSQLAPYGYTITRTYSDQNYKAVREQMRSEKTQYFSRCSNCGFEHKTRYTYSKTMKAIAKGPRYHSFACAKCKSNKLEVIKKYSDGMEEILKEIVI